MLRTLVIAASTVLPALPVAAQDIAAADVVNRDGDSIGTVSVSARASGTALVTIALNDIPEGEHAVHLHETGDCSAEDFTSAGGHIADDRPHGIDAEGGPHPGDLPNVIVQDDGIINAQFFNPHLVMVDMILDEDGSAFVMHEGADDYETQPAGDAGDRIACGVFVQSVD